MKENKKEFSYMNNVTFFDRARSRVRTGIAEIDRRWGWYLALGAFLIVLGTIAAGSAIATTVISVFLLGGILVCAGAALVFLSFLTGNWSGFLLTLAAGVLSGIIGITMLSAPLSGAVAITLVVGAALLAVGLFRTIASIIMRFPNWGWSLLSGIASITLGVLLLKDWQTASLWFVGLYIGIDLIFHGVSWIMFALGVHSLAGDLELTEEERRAA
jgi:uncharacterized membrane protein HdeD (DUF308 family)